MDQLDPAKNTSEELAENAAWNTLPPNRPRKVSGGMWGPLEIGAVAVGAVALLAATLAYFFFVLPSNRELARNRSEADRLEAELISARAKYGEITTTESQVAKIVSSVDDFEMNYLPSVTTGQSGLYQRLNGLIAAYGLVNTNGPDYAPLEPADQNAGQQTDEEKGRSKFRSLYPGVYVTTTVEGSYQNIRRFIREIETGREFLIVSSVELAPSDTEKKDKDTGSQPQTAGNPGDVYAPANPNLKTQPGQNFPPGVNPNFVQAQSQGTQRKSQGKMHGETVSLRIELAAYFRRPNMTPAPQQ